MVTITKKQSKELISLNPELKLLNKWLFQVKHGGNFPIAKLQKYGLIKQHTLKKGKMVQGRISGAKKKWVMTEKGKRMFNMLEALGI